MNIDRIKMLRSIAERYDTETAYRSMTLDTGQILDILDSYIEMDTRISEQDKELIQSRKIIGLLLSRLDENGMKILNEAMREACKEE